MAYVYTPIRQRANTFLLPANTDKCRQTTYAAGFEGALNRTEMLFANTSDALTVAQLKAVSGPDLFTGAVRPVKNGAGNPMGRYVFITGLATPVQTGVDTLAIQNTAATGWWLHEDLGSRVVKTRKLIDVDMYNSSFAAGSGFSRTRHLSGGAGLAQSGIVFSANSNVVPAYSASAKMVLPAGTMRGIVATMTGRCTNYTAVAGDILDTGCAFYVYEMNDYATAASYTSNATISGPGDTIYHPTIATLPGPFYTEGDASSLVWNATMGAVGGGLVAPSGVNARLISADKIAYFFNPNSLNTAAVPEIPIDGHKRYEFVWTPHRVTNAGTAKSLDTRLHSVQAVMDIIEVSL